jgi:hypothetical protein
VNEGCGATTVAGEGATGVLVFEIKEERLESDTGNGSLELLSGLMAVAVRLQ